MDDQERGEESTIQQQSGRDGRPHLRNGPRLATQWEESSGNDEEAWYHRTERRVRKDERVKKPLSDSLSRSVFLSALLSHLLRYAFSEIRRPLGGSLKIVEREATGGGKEGGKEGGIARWGGRKEGRGGEEDEEEAKRREWLPSHRRTDEGI
uniref:Uncharacterized protein n=1 Tax=Pristionchus pacificus TaxID=54126 RepID=A0A2A6B9L9_PRIPA|eukprot:PDM62566.1 hypothetical protein PRIPAC_52008 [Pristionchus pacificus]